MVIPLEILDAFASYLNKFKLKRAFVSLSGDQDYQSQVIVHGFHSVGFLARTRAKVAANMPTDTTLGWVVRGSSRLCTNPLDRVFRLLGLADDKLQDAVPINYDSTLLEVYLPLARGWVATYGRSSYDILHLMYLDSSLGFPSWFRISILQMPVGLPPPILVSQRNINQPVIVIEILANISHSCPISTTPGSLDCLWIKSDTQSLALGPGSSN
jgi:hypothetical protein